MWLLVAPRAAKVLMVMRASGSSRPILASTPRNGVVRGSQPETTARKSSRRLTRRCPVALQGEFRPGLIPRPNAPALFLTSRHQSALYLSDALLKPCAFGKELVTLGP